MARSFRRSKYSIYVYHDGKRVKPDNKVTPSINFARRTLADEASPFNEVIDNGFTVVEMLLEEFRGELEIELKK